MAVYKHHPQGDRTYSSLVGFAARHWNFMYPSNPFWYSTKPYGTRRSYVLWIVDPEYQPLSLVPYWRETRSPVCLVDFNSILNIRKQSTALKDAR
jgi:hypothetical protein